MDKTIADSARLAILTWVVAQGVGWFFPDVYGRFDAEREKAYYEHAQRIGLWNE